MPFSCARLRPVVFALALGAAFVDRAPAQCPPPPDVRADVAAAGQQTDPADGRPAISAIYPNPVVGSNHNQWLTLHGSGFDEGFSVRLVTDSVDAQITSSERLRFVSAAQVQVCARFGADAAAWQAQVVHPDGTRSEPYPFTVEAPVPLIETVGAEQQADTSWLHVEGHTLTPYSVLLWDGAEQPTEPVWSSKNPNAYVIGLRAPLPVADIEQADGVEVRVFTPGPGGGLSEPRYLLKTTTAFYETLPFQLGTLSAWRCWGSSPTASASAAYAGRLGRVGEAAGGRPGPPRERADARAASGAGADPKRRRPSSPSRRPGSGRPTRSRAASSPTSATSSARRSR